MCFYFCMWWIIKKIAYHFPFKYVDVVFLSKKQQPTLTRKSQNIHIWNCHMYILEKCTPRNLCIYMSRYNGKVKIAGYEYSLCRAALLKSNFTEK